MDLSSVLLVNITVCKEQNTQRPSQHMELLILHSSLAMASTKREQKAASHYWIYALRKCNKMITGFEILTHLNISLYGPCCPCLRHSS